MGLTLVGSCRSVRPDEFVREPDADDPSSARRNEIDAGLTDCKPLMVATATVCGVMFAVSVGSVLKPLACRLYGGFEKNRP